MESRGGGMAMVGIWVILLFVMAELAFRKSVALHQFDLVHGYAHLGESPEYYKTLRKHDQRRLRRMLPEVVTFPVTGDDDIFTTGLYYTRISLGTPPQKFYVHVDTGSDVVWVNCVPCSRCKRSSNVELPISIYDPVSSSTSTSITCSDTQCRIASYPSSPKCSAASLECPYSTLYGDGSSTNGYFVSDLFTFNQVPSGGNSTDTSGSATLTFGCGSNQTGSWATDGLIGFGQAAISAPSQLSAQSETVNIFAHCLQGDNKGGGSLVIGSIREPDVAYTPIVPKQNHYNVELLNVAVDGTNVSSPASFDLATTGGVIFDSGTTLTYLVQPALGQFQSGTLHCCGRVAFQILKATLKLVSFFSSSIELYFPNVTLYFAGGAVMTLSPKNYLYKETLLSGLEAYCFSWLESVNTPGYMSYTIFGDNVLKDKLVVYDNANKQIGWKNFDCTKGISISSTPTSVPVTVLPSAAGPPGAFSHSPSYAPQNRASFGHWLWIVALVGPLIY